VRLNRAQVLGVILLALAILVFLVLRYWKYL